jgi:hypothetical protein
LFHYPLDFAEGDRQIVRQTVILHHSPILGLIVGYDAEVTVGGQFRSMGGFVATLIALTFLVDHLIRNAEANPCIDTPASFAVLGVVLQGVDFIAEKSGSLLSGVRDERFGTRKFQLERIAQVFLELVLDRFGFRLRAVC